MHSVVNVVFVFRFCSDGAVAIDNNVSEREMKRVVLTHKNSLFVGYPRGGRTGAILAGLASTCRHQDLDPQLYLTQLLTNLSQVRKSKPPNWLPISGNGFRRRDYLRLKPRRFIGAPRTG
jgi:hypothetical protein